MGHAWTRRGTDGSATLQNCFYLVFDNFVKRCLIGERPYSGAQAVPGMYQGSSPHIGTTMYKYIDAMSKLRHSLADLSDVEVEQLHDEAVRAAVVDVRHAAHEVVVRRAQALQHVALTLQRALVLSAALEELQRHRGAFEVLLSDAGKVQFRMQLSG